MEISEHFSKLAERLATAQRENAALRTEYVEDPVTAEYAANAVRILWEVEKFICEHPVDFPCGSHAYYAQGGSFSSPSFNGRFVTMDFDHTCGYYDNRPSGTEGHYCGEEAKQTPEYYKTHKWTREGWKIVRACAERTLARAKYYEEQYEEAIVKLEKTNAKLKAL